MQNDKNNKQNFISNENPLTIRHLNTSCNIFGNNNAKDTVFKNNYSIHLNSHLISFNNSNNNSKSNQLSNVIHKK